MSLLKFRFIDSDSDEELKMAQTKFPKIHHAFAQYYKNFQLIKTSEVKELSMYKAPVISLINDATFRYIVIIVKNDANEIGTIKKLSELNWFVFQTRTLPYNQIKDSLELTLKPMAVNQSNPPELLADAKIYKTKNDQHKFYYSSTIQGLSVELLKTKTHSNYNDQGSLLTALEQYATVIILF